MSTQFQNANKIKFMPLPYIGMFDLDVIYQSSDAELLYQVLYKLNEIAKSQNIIIDNFQKIIEWATDQIEKFTKDQLEEWLNDGTLTNIILSLGNVIKYFNTTTEMLETTNLVKGMYVETKGYETPGDNGNAKFYITDVLEDNIFQYVLQNGLYANIIDIDSVYVESFGINDNLNPIADININKGLKNINLSPYKTYTIGDISLNNVNINGNNATINITDTITILSGSNQVRNYVKDVNFRCGDNILKNIIVKTDETSGNLWGGNYNFYRCQFYGYNYTCLELQACFNIDINECTFFNNKSQYSVAVNITNINDTDNITDSSFSNCINISNSWLNGNSQQGTLIRANDCINLNIINSAIELANTGILNSNRLQNVNINNVWFERLTYVFSGGLPWIGYNGAFYSNNDYFYNNYNLDNGYFIAQFPNATDISQIYAAISNLPDKRILTLNEPNRITLANNNNNFTEIKQSSFLSRIDNRIINRIELTSASFGDIINLNNLNSLNMDFIIFVSGINTTGNCDSCIVMYNNGNVSIINRSNDDSFSVLGDYIKCNNLSNVNAFYIPMNLRVD